MSWAGVDIEHSSQEMPEESGCLGTKPQGPGPWPTKQQASVAGNWVPLLALMPRESQ